MVAGYRILQNIKYRIMYVFRNNTVERFFPKGYSFSGYDDISIIPANEEGFIWFYQLPVKFNIDILISEVSAYAQKLQFVISKISESRNIIAVTICNINNISYTESDKIKLEEAISRYNIALFELSNVHDNVKVICIDEFYSSYPASSLVDWKYYFISQMGINPRLSNDFQKWWQRKLEGIALKRKKCIVLDLDNTLWGGILGEDGIDGIKIGGDYPGKAFLYFQEALLELSKNGIILTVCSKNNESDVIEAWEKNPFMVLKKEHFITYRINWKDKASNISDIATELNIGLDSFVFIDDNPTERELVKQALPMVCVPDFPEHPYELPSFTKKIVEDYFRVYSITDEDKKKTEQYKANAARSNAQQSFTDFTSFLRSLDMRLVVERANVHNISRIAQMTQKTNQFNLTTKRYTESDIRQFVDDGWQIWCLSVSDKFGDNGITGCIMVNNNCIDTLLLSCRILGKGIEMAFIKTILSILKDEGISNISAKYIRTLKNSQVEDFYDNCGFKCTKNSDDIKDYVIDASHADLEIEDYYHITVK